MSESIPDRADMRQLRIQAKELLGELQGGDVISPGVAAGTVKLADAQLLIARKYGYESWPKLVAGVEIPALLQKLKSAIEAGNSEALERLLESKPRLRNHINDPMFGFDSPPILQATSHAQAVKLLPILVRYGADPNARSKWWAGGFSPLDYAKGDAVQLLLNLGAKFDIWSAAAQGRLDVVRDLLDSDPGLVNAPGGDGERPLHFAATTEIAELLIERGAALELRDVDHESTPTQYQINNPEIVRVLLQHGAEPDVFTAVALDDPFVLHQVLKDDPAAACARVGTTPFITTQSNGGHIYAYRLGPNKTPLQVAVEKGCKVVLSDLQSRATPAERLIAAAWMNDAATVNSILRDHPNIGKGMAEDARAITDAAQAGKTETVRLLLEAGLDPATPGMDSGSALHVACWFGHLEAVELLVGHVPLDLKDAHHGSPPLGWATHGAQWCRNPNGDYVGVVEALMKAGADHKAPANSEGTSLMDQAGKREDIKRVLRRS